ncbi:MAG: integrase [Sutterellaceae bacterium]|uniref:tyrosine-type recombinase/integrase n=1 Tax=uncultured Limnobacter sp. TaxID=199681 RepID=UPI000C5B7342|nr:integrase [Sutterellaceae bacterium]MBT84115.1 integrase [Sutterellaceae bacterium]|tara:strand:- start:1045 stop:2019 length:975 start_codon:yes stop_codon:yes gene_type:complete
MAINDPNSVEVLEKSSRQLSREVFSKLRDIPPEVEWFANIDNVQTRRAYKNDLNDFMAFVGLDQVEDLRSITRAHVLAWRTDLEQRTLAKSTVRRKLAALSSLFNYLSDANAVQNNPVDGVKRPKVDTYEGKTPTISDVQARELLSSPDKANKSIKLLRDKALLSTLLFHALRREELCLLKVGDIEERRGVKHLKVSGKGGKTRYLPLNPGSASLIYEYLAKAGHGEDRKLPLFRRLNEKSDVAFEKHMTADAIYKIVRHYSGVLDFPIGVHSLRATAATNALDHDADIKKVQEWLGHANIATTQIYDRRRTKPEDSPTFKVSY